MPEFARLQSDRLRPITSRHNPRLKQLRSAFAQASPTDDGAVAIEGLKLVAEALSSGLTLRALFVSHAACTRATPRLAALLAALSPATEVLLVPDDLLQAAVASESPQGVAALVQPLVATLDDLFTPRRTVPTEDASASHHSQEDSVDNASPAFSPLILGCAALQDPGNLGTILRSAEAFGASGVVCTEGTVSTANAKVARASAGAVFRLPCLKLPTAELLDALRTHHIRLAITASHAVGGRAPLALDQADLRAPIAIFIGNEGQGVPAALAEAAELALTIPHSPRTESLNAAIAASILLYEAHRQRSR